MVNPFDLRSILLEKHAQHVVFIHFPIALFITGVSFDLLSRGKRDRSNLLPERGRRKDIADSICCGPVPMS